jgi:alcohol dehydrogenase class IV
MLLVCSKSTRGFFPEIKRYLCISSSLTSSELLRLKDTEEEVIAVGGGAVIDAAKVICKNPIICYPTTAAGTCYTSHSVFWEGPDKKSIKSQMPKQVIVEEEFLKSIPNEVLSNTRYDALSHCLDSMWSIHRTKESIKLCERSLEILKSPVSNKDLITAGNLAGKAINLCPTTILHSFSYPLTGFYNVPHGKGLGAVLQPVCDYMDFDVSPYLFESTPKLPDIDCDLVAREINKYKKILDISCKIGYNDIYQILESIEKR